MIHEVILRLNANDIGNKKVIILNPEEWMQQQWVNGQFYELTMLNYIKDNYKNGTFIDVGACMGNHTLFFSDIADKVIAFEPIKENFYHLTMNIQLNKINNIEYYNVGLSNKPELKTIWHDDRFFSNGSASITSPTEHTKQKRLIPVIDLDSFNIADVTLIKIDVEGYNIPVLEGSINTIKKYLPDMFIECSTEKEFKEVFKFLKPLGYIKPELIFNGTPTYLFSTIKAQVNEK